MRSIPSTTEKKSRKRDGGVMWLGNTSSSVSYNYEKTPSLCVAAPLLLTHQGGNLRHHFTHNHPMFKALLALLES